MPIRRVAPGLFLLLILLFPASILWWHAVDNRPSSMDETRHMKLSMDYREWLFRGVPLTNEWSHVYPPLYHFSLLGPLSLGTVSEAKAAVANIGYFCVFVLACLLLGRRMGKPDWESLSVAFLTVGYGYIYWASRRALTDFPLTALVTLSLAFLTSTEGFSSRRWSILWGISAALGLLLKVPFLFFLIGPIAWVYFQSHHPDRFKNLMIGLGVMLVLVLPWFYWQSAYFLSKGSSLAAEYQGPGTDPKTFAGWIFYLKILPFQLRWPSLVFTIVGLVFVFWKRPDKHVGFFLVWFLSGYCILSALVNKDPRHTLALLPALAFLSISGWTTFVEKWGKPKFVAIIPPVLMLWNMASYDRPAKEDWKHSELLQLMTARHDPSQPFLLASLLSHHPRLFSRTLKWSAMQKNIDLRMVSPGNSNTSFTEFIITRPGDQGSENAFIDKQWLKLKPETRAFKEIYPFIAQFPLPDGSYAFVHQRQSHPDFKIPGMTASEIGRKIAQSMNTWTQSEVKVSVEGKPSELRKGKLRRVRITCAPCSIQGGIAKKVEVVVEKPWLNLYRLWDEKRLGLMAFESLKPSIVIEAKDLSLPLQKIKGLKDAQVEFSDGKIRVRGKYQRIPVKAVLHLELDNGPFPSLIAVLDYVTVWAVPLPGWILGKAHRQPLWLYPLPDFPGRILVNEIRVENGQLVIS